MIRCNPSLSSSQRLYFAVHVVQRMSQWPGIGVVVHEWVLLLTLLHRQIRSFGSTAEMGCIVAGSSLAQVIMSWGLGAAPDVTLQPKPQSTSSASSGTPAALAAHWDDRQPIGHQ
jgi:hypothetical protein